MAKGAAVANAFRDLLPKSVEEPKMEILPGDIAATGSTDTQKKVTTHVTETVAKGAAAADASEDHVSKSVEEPKMDILPGDIAATGSNYIKEKADESQPIKRAAADETARDKASKVQDVQSTRSTVDQDVNVSTEVDLVVEG